MKKIEIERKLYSVTDMADYVDNQDLYSPKTTAIQIGDVVLPIRNAVSDNGPGIYYTPGCVMCDVIKPSPQYTADYSAEKIIDLSKPKDIGEVISKNDLIRSIQSDLMVSGKDNVFHLTVSQHDTPEMAALKNAINAKQTDKKLYEERFPQFQNDMRLLKGNSITLRKMIDICDGFDISCILTLKDKEGCVNPMNTEISLDLTEGRPVNETTSDDSSV